MFLWLISPKNVFHGERISRVKKSTLSAMIAFIYVFAYINLQEVKHRQKMVRNALIASFGLFRVMSSIQVRRDIN
jgi:XK-related protein